ncbi:MAG: hypothetical protein HY943_17060 [Gammaproteobacteria bacterium]|nr:hypothetical protein [Gammaproteobacteria bacterium]
MYRQWKKLGAAVALAIGLGAPSAHAATEDLSIDNSTPFHPQFVSSFSPEGIINVFGLRGEVYGGLILDDSNPDFYAFIADANRVITITVASSNGPNFGDDPKVGLFDGIGGPLLASDNDSGPGFDALLSYKTWHLGIYLVAVTGSSDLNFNLGGGSTNFPYLLTIKSAAVPVPGAAVLLGSGLLGLAGVKRRRS